MAAGPELCPHCGRPFKRLRAHLPHCKAAPAPPADSPRAAPADGPGPAGAPAPSGSAPAPGTDAPGRRARVRDVARSLDLHPEEVRGVAAMLRRVPVVMHGHRARLGRAQEPRDGGAGTERAPAARRTAPTPQGRQARSRDGGGAGEGAAKATGTAEPAGSGDSPAGLGRRQPSDKDGAGGERGRRGAERPACALHPPVPPLALAVALAAHGPGTARAELRLRGQPLPQPGPSTAPGLPLPQSPPRRTGARAAALEWLPELYPEPAGLSIFPGNRCQEDVRIEVETAGGGVAQGQQAWSSYCAKYIHVKQGAPAGISMLLAGYCLLSYGWNYQHFKRHRWRKYH
ncbi:uncharacterized protein C17orf80 homolog isoform X2 [Passer domesticus]|uniref:uncharacterized protein C17orf80 homolog isoform X2 n=1 Tax=Passer domesticus TaxID=48849 RepID=UPI0030FE10DB